MTEDQIAEAVSLAAGLCRKFEGLRLAPYLCPARVPTIGYGSTVYEDGRGVTLADAPISADRADALLRHDLTRTRLPAVLKLCPGVDTPARLAVLLDFAYNVGNGNLAQSTLLKRAQAGRWGDVPAELAKWVRGGGQVLPGLVKRRAAEAALLA